MFIFKCKQTLKNWLSSIHYNGKVNLIRLIEIGIEMPLKEKNWLLHSNIYLPLPTRETSNRKDGEKPHKKLKNVEESTRTSPNLSNNQFTNVVNNNLSGSN